MQSLGYKKFNSLVNTYTETKLSMWVFWSCNQEYSRTAASNIYLQEQTHLPGYIVSFSK